MIVMVIDFMIFKDTNPDSDFSSISSNVRDCSEERAWLEVGGARQTISKSSCTTNL